MSKLKFCVKTIFLLGLKDQHFGKMGLRDQNNGKKIGINGSRIYHVTTLYRRDKSLSEKRSVSVVYKWESEEQGNCFYFFSNWFDEVICPNLFKCCRFTRSNQRCGLSAEWWNYTIVQRKHSSYIMIACWTVPWGKYWFHKVFFKLLNWPQTFES